VCTIHDLAALDHPEWFSPKFTAWYQWLIPRLVRRIRHVIAVSEFTKQRLVAVTGLDRRNITVVLNGVDERFRPAAADQVCRVKRELGIESDEFLLYVGSLEPRKNLARLLDAWALIDKTGHPGLELVIAGARGRSAVFSDTCDLTSMPNVHFVGYVSEEQLPVLYSDALALVYPSLYEGFGLPPLEAMACGTPVVTSNVTALPEVVGDAAIQVDPTDPRSIAKGIQQLLDDPYLADELARRGLSRVRELTWERTAQHTWNVLQDYLS
jgi:glycosyltransferase involved in cell wall biosynthesis